MHIASNNLIIFYKGSSLSKGSPKISYASMSKLIQAATYI